MYRALDQGIIHIQKLVFLPFKAGTCMRALVSVGVETTILVDNKYALRFAFDFDLEAFTAGVRNIAAMAQQDFFIFSHNVC